MILKIRRKRFKTKDKEDSAEGITEFHYGNSFIEANGVVIIDNKESIDISDYEQLDVITNEFIQYETKYAFIMNDEGKTIERLI
jgi:hypothetical protein